MTKPEKAGKKPAGGGFWRWAIAVIYFAGGAWLILAYAILLGGKVALSRLQLDYVATLDMFDYVSSALILCANLAGAVALVRLRKSALYFFCFSLVVSVFSTALNAATQGLLAAIGRSGIAGIIGGWALNLVACYYSYRLKRSRVLS